MDSLNNLKGEAEGEAEVETGEEREDGRVNLGEFE